MKVEPISPYIGAIVTGVDLYQERGPDLQNMICELLGRHEVLFFKGQPQLQPAEYLETARLMGRPMKHPFISTNEPVMPGISPFQPYPDYTEITGIYHNKQNRGNLNEWHSDLNWLQEPSLGSVLRCLQRAPVGGDTLWASMTAAYEFLPQERQLMLSELRVIHDFSQIYRGSFAGKDAELVKMQGYYPAQAHPLVLTHPIYKKKSLFANRVSAVSIEGWTKEESQKLLEEIYILAKRPEFQCRYRWDVNDIAVWDNLLTQHYAVSDYWPFERKMERISLGGVAI